MFTTLRRRVNPTSRPCPVTNTVVLFDGTRPIRRPTSRPFGVGLQDYGPDLFSMNARELAEFIDPSLRPEEPLTAAEMAEIDEARQAAYLDHLPYFSADVAAELAGDHAELARQRILTRRRLARESREVGHGTTRRGPTSADLAWWAANSPANREGYEVVGRTEAAVEFAAGSALAQARMSAGYPLF